MTRKRALLTGITGQDGSYLAEFLLQQGYEVHGLVRRSSIDNTARIEHLIRGTDGTGGPVQLHYGDPTDTTSILRIVREVEPAEIYNLGAQSHVQVSFDTPEYTADVGAIGALRILEAIRLLGMADTARFYQASTSELFGNAEEVPQRESTPFHPRSPYGVAKLYSYWVTVNYREARTIHASNGILFNHESPRRGVAFVARKISQAVARISLGRQDCLYLGSLDAKRDWGYAQDYVEAMWLIVQHEVPDDYVIATGQGHSVREFTEAAFAHAGIGIEWRGRGVDEVGICHNTEILKAGTVVVRIDPSYYRPTEVPLLVGDASKARRVLNWKPKTSFNDIVAMMVDADMIAEQRTCP